MIGKSINEKACQSRFIFSRTYNMAKAAIVKLESYTAAVREATKERPSNAEDPD